VRLFGFLHKGVVRCRVLEVFEEAVYLEGHPLIYEVKVGRRAIVECTEKAFLLLSSSRICFINYSLYEVTHVLVSLERPGEVRTVTLVGEAVVVGPIEVGEFSLEK
jgi:hypothetical protein